MGADAFAIAQMMAQPDAGDGLRLRFGTVAEADGTGLVRVVPDGASAPVPAVDWCRAAPGSRVALLVKGAQWLAVASSAEREADAPAEERPLPVALGGTGKDGAQAALASLMAASSTTTVPCGYSYNVPITKLGRLAFASAYVNSTSNWPSVTNWTKLVEVMPSALRPASTAHMAGVQAGTGAEVVLAINSDGTMYFFSNSKTVTNLMMFTGAWVTAS
jgi:hypothetical protein